MSQFIVVVVATLMAIVAVLLYYYAFIYDSFRPKSIEGKRVLVTGSSSGIGEQIAYFYSRLGARLVITGLEEDLLMEVAATCKTLGAKKVEYVVADMSVAEERTELVQETERHLGGLDHLILNHGIMSAFLWKGSAENVAFLERQMTVNFISFVDIASKCLDMLKASKGNIGVNSSVGAKITVSFGHSYAASKHALEGFFVSFREELKLADNGISITIAYLGMAATETSRRVLKVAFGSHADSLPPAASVVESAAAIARGICTRKRDVIFPFHMHAHLILHKIMPVSYISSVSKQQYSWVNE